MRFKEFLLEDRSKQYRALDRFIYIMVDPAPWDGRKIVHQGDDGLALIELGEKEVIFKRRPSEHLCRTSREDWDRSTEAYSVRDRKFLNDLKEEEMSAVDFVRNVFAKNYAQHMKTDIKEVDVQFKQTEYSKPKQCFNNALQYLIVENPKAEYVLGFTMVHGIPIEHAIVKEDGKYFDVTLKNTDKFVTMVELNFKQVMKFFSKNSFGPTLWDVVRTGLAK